MNTSCHYRLTEEQYISSMTELLLHGFTQSYDGEIIEYPSLWDTEKEETSIQNHFADKIHYCTNFIGTYNNKTISVSLRHHCFPRQRELQHFEVLLEGEEAQHVAAYVLGIIEAFRSLLLQTSN